MLIQLIAVGNRMPAWVTDGYEEFVKRLPRECELVLREIKPIKRFKHADIGKIREEEGERILELISRDDHVVALEVGGQAWSSEKLADQLNNWMQNCPRVALLVGGPDGLSSACTSRSVQQWSLSQLTLPHPIVRIIVAEQIYRAWSILNHHPYHR